MRDELVTYTNPKSPLAEMFKTLRTNVQFMTKGNELKSVLITSTLPGEGKSWTTSNLAVTFSQAGKKVIVLDADMRKGRQFNIFNVSPRLGLSNYLSGVADGNIINRNDLNTFIKKTDIPLLDVLPAGDVPPNPSELLVSEKMEQLLNELKNMYDLVVIDAPPCLLVTDAIILSRIVDNTLIVVSHKETKTDDLNKIKKDIENVGGKVSGVVINKMPSKQNKYGYEYYGNTKKLANSKSGSLKSSLLNFINKKTNNKNGKRKNRVRENEAIELGGVQQSDASEILKQIAEYLENNEKEKI